MLAKEMREYLNEDDEQIEVVSLRQKSVRICSVKEFLDQSIDTEILVSSRKGRLRFYEK